MPANVLTIGQPQADSADVVVTSPTLFCLKGASGNLPQAAVVRVFVKDDLGAYTHIDTLTVDKPAGVIIAPGTYMFRRTGSASVGVFSG